MITDGATAVPVDIGRIDAALVFDGAAGTAHGDATVAFAAGPRAGRPILDLRQTVTGVWLDGKPVAPSGFGLHDVGGGAHAEVRVLARRVAARSVHTLRVTYDLGPPQASAGPAGHRGAPRAGGRPAPRPANGCWSTW